MNTELSDLDTLKKLPKTEPPRTTLLDILDVATKEIYITQAYAYFLDQRSGFDYQEEFARCFFNEIPGTEGQKWSECEVLSEQTVHLLDKELRIDLLFLIENEALIVENKIFAGKYNDMGGYETGVKERFQRSTVRTIFLSFETQENQITHQAICGNMKTFLETVAPNERDHQYYQILEFVEHLINLSKVIGNMEDASLYIEHASAIKNAVQLKQRALEYIDLKIREIALELVATHLKGVENASNESLVEQKKGSWIHVRPRPGDTSIYLTIAYRDFLEEGKACPVYLIIESTKLVDTQIETYFGERKKLGILKSDRRTSSWRHYFYAEVKMNENEKMEDFLERIKSCASTIFQEIVKFQSQKSHD